MTDLVSVLIPVFNRGAIIAQTLESALAQTYTNLEVVVVDNASTDDTWSVIQGYAARDSRVKPVRNDHNIGPVRNWLRCVEAASGKYAKILWSDDLVGPDFLEKTLALLDADTAFVYTSVVVFSDSPSTGRSCYAHGQSGHYPSEHYIDRALFYSDVPVSPGCALFRLADVKANLRLHVPNKVNSDFSMHAIGNDLLLFLLTAIRYKKYGFVGEPLSFFRAHEGSITMASGSVKLPLHYLMAKAYFVENYRPEYKRKLVALAQLFMWKCPGTGDFDVKEVHDLFNGRVSPDYYFLMRTVIHRVIKSPLKVGRSIVRRFRGQR